ncbi:PA2169 family four-helix-bundle protein [Leeuwenhoekiella sp. A16]|uniref:ferritin-like domain-containing protein n=1 Tax=unclassified Leeuwenhoekiella TaxID=2615029 RepID=UPI003A8005CC
MKTTLEEAKERNHDEIVSDLQELLEKNYDAEKGFKKAIEDAKNPNLKAYLKNQAFTRNRFATEIDKILHDLNEHPKESGSTAGTLHRTWIDIKTAVTGHSDESILEECIRGDKASVEEYEEKLKDNRFTPEIASVLQKQLADIRQTLSTTKSLENLTEQVK